MGRLKRRLISATIIGVNDRRNEEAPKIERNNGNTSLLFPPGVLSFEADLSPGKTSTNQRKPRGMRLAKMKTDLPHIKFHLLPKLIQVANNEKAQPAPEKAKKAKSAAIKLLLFQ